MQYWYSEASLRLSGHLQSSKKKWHAGTQVPAESVQVLCHSGSLFVAKLCFHFARSKYLRQVSNSTFQKVSIKSNVKVWRDQQFQKWKWKRYWIHDTFQRRLLQKSLVKFSHLATPQVEYSGPGYWMQARYWLHPENMTWSYWKIDEKMKIKDDIFLAEKFMPLNWWNNRKNKLVQKELD